MCIYIKWGGLGYRVGDQGIEDNEYEYIIFIIGSVHITERTFSPLTPLFPVSFKTGLYID